MMTLLHPDMYWHYLNGMGAQKNTLKKVAMGYIALMIYLKTKRQSLQILWKQKFS